MFTAKDREAIFFETWQVAFAALLLSRSPLSTGPSGLSGAAENVRCRVM
jgi:hypothetical protein